MSDTEQYRPGPRFGQKARYRPATVEYVLSGEEMYRFWERENELVDELQEARKALEYLVAQDWLDDPRGVAAAIEKASAALESSDAG